MRAIQSVYRVRVEPDRCRRRKVNGTGAAHMRRQAMVAAALVEWAGVLAVLAVVHVAYGYMACGVRCAVVRAVVCVAFVGGGGNGFGVAAIVAAAAAAVVASAVVACGDVW